MWFFIVFCITEGNSESLMFKTSLYFVDENRCFFFLNEFFESPTVADQIDIDHLAGSLKIEASWRSWYDPVLWPQKHQGFLMMRLMWFWSLFFFLRINFLCSTWDHKPSASSLRQTWPANTKSWPNCRGFGSARLPALCCRSWRVMALVGNQIDTWDHFIESMAMSYKYIKYMVMTIWWWNKYMVKTIPWWNVSGLLLTILTVKHLIHYL